MDIPKIVLITTIFTFLNTSAILARSIAVIDNEPEFRDPNDGKRRLSMIVEDATAEREWGKSWTMIFNVVGIPLICIGACCLLYVSLISMYILSFNHFKVWHKVLFQQVEKGKE